jgi:hypothetical protein
MKGCAGINELVGGREGGDFRRMARDSVSLVSMMMMMMFGSKKRYNDGHTYLRAEFDGESEELSAVLPC